MKGIMEMNPTAAAKMYPDANFSMRVSYGNVKSYSPRDAVKYDYVTTSRGVLEKYIPGDYEFDLPKKKLNCLKIRILGSILTKTQRPCNWFYYYQRYYRRKQRQPGNGCLWQPYWPCF